ncbi:hypothetical protein [Alkalibacterium sp. 20]|uniref:YqgU-like beta propeller domain-containing protein n=1 Tax=Alkalibacterium sp. 20 TaxID=1798803 RepID=UPI0009004FAD|nr:hypothetical protein [Alkalibacterium sp. 20]OJF90941.1 hypothetical protein AX762_03995 [Alkalibacterium sp. 20]
MSKKKSQNNYVPFLLLCCCLFLFACQRGSYAVDERTISPDQSEDSTLTPIDIQYESFQKVIGWLTEDEILIHIGNTEGHELLTYNIFSGEKNTIYNENLAILSVEINQSRDKILLQEVSETQSRLTVITTDGLTVQSTPFDYSSYVTLDWNPTDNNTVFISHYSFDHVQESEMIHVYVWTIDENTLNTRDIPSLSPKWYSANVYLYIDELETNAMYIGDIRDDREDMLLNMDISDFFLSEDTFLGVVESDIQDNVVHLFHEYPFLVGDKVLSIPKVTINDYPVKPHLTQATRNGKIYGVIPEYSFALEEDLGNFSLSYLDFENEEIEEVMELSEDAPIALSPSEEYLLYGWRFEYIIDLSEQRMIPLLEEFN